MFLSLAALCSTLIPSVIASNAPNWMLQSWFFDWTTPGSPYPVPITAQCETIHITWERGSASGPDGVAPFYLQIYTSNYPFPFILPAGPDPQADVTIPFAPGTLYQICMFDSNGNNGGCQDVYTVYANSNSSVICSNFTMPAETLSAKLESSSGPLSPYGWIPSCTDLSVTPQSGTPPFTLTIAPTLHPPLNITSHDMSPINWTVSLSWASSFFVSLVDAKGVTWSAGLLHSGNGDVGCLSGSRPRKTGGISVGATVGAAIGGLLVGTLLSILATFFFFRKHNQNPIGGKSFGMDLGASADHIEPYRYPSFSTTPSSPHPVDDLSLPSAAHTSPISSSGKRRSHAVSHRTTVSVHTLGEDHDSNHPTVSPSDSNDPGPLASGAHQLSPISHQLSPIFRRSTSGLSETQIQSPSHSRTPSRVPSIAGELSNSSNQVYVIHHDSGRPPVSVITSPGTQVVELPPGYSDDFLPPQPKRRSTQPSNTKSRLSTGSHLRVQES